MYSLAYIRRCYPCFIILAVIGLAQFYIFVMNDPLAGYMRNTLSSFFSRGNTRQKHVAKRTGPVHVLLISYARTGGAFVGDLLQSHPEAFYFFEPLHFFGQGIIRSNFPEARLLLRRLFLCQTMKTPGFMYWQELHKSYMKMERSYGYWEACTEQNSCFDPRFLDRYCAKKKAVVIRTSRMTLREASSLYDDFPELNLKIVYLSRDPRGTINSRSREFVRDWCMKDLYCYDTSSYCSILKDDLIVACKLLRDRPNDFMILRYEDLSREPYTFAHSLVDYLGYDNNTNEMQLFLREHTNAFVRYTIGKLHYLYNTYRNSLLTSSAWRQEMSYDDAKHVQYECSDVLDAYGYDVYKTAHIMEAGVYLDNEVQPSIKSYCSRTSANA